MEHRPHLKSVRDWIRQIFCGVCMGAADLVPGISGGTMALILGIYEDLIFSIKSLASKDVFSFFNLKRFHERVSWDFLLALLIGVLISFATLSQLVQKLLSGPTSRMYLHAFFVGMILASVGICYSHIKSKKRVYVFLFIVGALVTYFVTGSKAEPMFEGASYSVYYPLEQNKSQNYDSVRQSFLNVSEDTLAAMLSKNVIDSQTPVVNEETGEKGVAGDVVIPKELGWFQPWLVVCGALAVSAMLLPGVSGSYLLAVLGVYALVIGSLADFFREGDWDAIVVLSHVGVGIALGALIFSKLIAFFLDRYHDATMVLLLGFMVGALQTVWPFFTYQYVIDPLRPTKGEELVILDPFMPSLISSEFLTAFGVVGVGLVLVIVASIIGEYRE